MDTATTPTVASLAASITHARDTSNGRVRFTVERGNGATYRTDEWTIYAHDSYPRHSVLHGRSRRRFVDNADGGEAGLNLIKAAFESEKIEYTVSGSSYRHDALLDLPDDDG